MTSSLLAFRKKSAPLIWLLATMLCVLPLRQHAIAGLAGHVTEWVVMCFGEDGHVDVEGTHSHDGDQEAAASEPSIKEWARTTCQDVPLLGGHLDGETKPEDPVKPELSAGSATVSVLPRLLVADEALPVHRMADAHLSEPRALLRTVVLLN